jgi:hypothetical protein
MTISAPLGTPRHLRALALLVGASLLIVVIPLTENAGLYAIAAGLFCCCIGPAWYRWQRGRFDAFETLHVIGLTRFVYFGLGAIWTVQDPSRVAYDIYLVPYIPLAALYCLLGYACLLGGYFGPWFQERAPRRYEDWPGGVMILLVPGIIGFMGRLAGILWTKAYWLGVSLPKMMSSLAQFGSLFLFAWAMGWMLVLSGRATRAQKMIVFGMLVPMTGIILAGLLTDKSLTMTLLGVPLLALWYTKRKLPWFSLVAMLLILIFLVFPFYNTYRRLDPRIATATRVTMTWDLMTRWDFEEYSDRSIGSFKLRMSLVNSVAVVIRDVPRWVPYARGDTLILPTLSFFVPRVIWPDKPVLTLGRDFGETFRVVHILDEKTWMSSTVPGELYWNFDLPGILFGMALWGAAMRFLYRRYGEAEGVDPIRRASHVLLLIQLVHFGGSLSAQTADLVRTLIVLELFCLLSRRLGWIESRPVKPVVTSRPEPTRALAAMKRI